MAQAKPTTKAVVKKVEEINGHNPVVKAFRTVLLAAVGTVALGKEEIEAIVDRLVEKGEIAEKDGRELLTDLFDRRKKDVSKAEDKVGSALDQRIESILGRMNIPSKADVDGLSQKITALAAKVDELTKKLAA